ANDRIHRPACHSLPRRIKDPSAASHIYHAAVGESQPQRSVGRYTECAADGRRKARNVQQRCKANPVESNEPRVGGQPNVSVRSLYDIAHVISGESVSVGPFCMDVSRERRITILARRLRADSECDTEKSP